MGEVAEMMLDGTLCEGCGEVLIGPEEEPAGFPQYCTSCAPDYEKESAMNDENELPEPRYVCTVCNKQLKTLRGYFDHYTNKHVKVVS